MGKHLMDEGANISIYDPKVKTEQIIRDLEHPDISSDPSRVKRMLTIHDNPYSALEDSHALIVCTEWDEFKTMDFERIYKGMLKPAFVFDGRLILDHQALKSIGFNVYVIGKRV